MTSAGGKGLRSEINVTPLIDVVLVLLIVFMVVVPILQTGYVVATPPARPSEPLAGRQLIVRMDRDGRTYLNRAAVPRNELPDRIRAAVENGNRTLFFAADGELPYGEVAEVMDLCRNAGAKRLGIVFEDLKTMG
jgi:biopolymer transport protein ExbD